MLGKRVYFESYGCTFNKFDLGVMKAHLKLVGCVIINSPESADILVINTCGAKRPTEDKILHRLNILRDLDKPMIITGCLPKIDLLALEKTVPEYLALIDPFSIDQITSAIAGVEQGKWKQCFFSDEAKVKLEMLQSRENLLKIMPISEGCLGSCSFCCVRFARGQLFSYPLKTIVKRVKESVLDGVGEIWITAQDTGAYGLDRNYNLATLLNEICKIRGSFSVRVGMMNPNNVLRILDGIVEAYKNEKIFKFLHLPIQSGNDTVLSLMNRSYTVNDFKKIVKAFRRAIPYISISTDIICGYPGEDEEAFEDSLKLVREVEPDVVNVSKFFPRPNTAAARMKQLKSQTVKIRTEKMAKLCKTISFKRNRRWLGWVGEVFITEKGKNSSMVGRNFAYKHIVINGKDNLLGRRKRVRVKKATPTYLIGELM